MNVIFIHAALLSGVESRLQQYLSAISESGLVDPLTTIYIVYVGPGNIPEVSTLTSCPRVSAKIVQNKMSEDLTSHELPTHWIIYTWCQSMREHISLSQLRILYLHTKHVGKEPNPCIEDQVEYTLYFLVHQWRDCLSALDRGYETAGVDLRDTPTLHYSGNFWWSTGAHIASLPNPVEYSVVQNPLNSRRHNQEFWICSPKRRESHFCIHDCGIDVYSRHLVRYEPFQYRADAPAPPPAPVQKNDSPPPPPPPPSMEFTFGIITDGSVEENIEKMIDSIESNGIPKYEVIIVGNSKVQRDRTLVIPFDETQTPGAWITRKKNIVVKMAQYENVVLLHDYVALESDWYSGFLKFGNEFDWCVSRIQTQDGTRFRDYSLLWNAYREIGGARIRLHPYFETHGLLPYSFQNTHYTNSFLYISGTYYVIKRRVAETSPLNEQLLAFQGEDTELSLRLHRKGVMVQCNPHSTVRFLKEKGQCFWENEIDEEHAKLFDTLAQKYAQVSPPARPGV